MEEEPEKKFHEEQEEERCEVNDCKINSCEDNIQWVSCDFFHSWWSLFCLDLSTTTKKYIYKCPKC